MASLGLKCHLTTKQKSGSSAVTISHGAKRTKLKSHVPVRKVASRTKVTSPYQRNIIQRTKVDASMVKISCQTTHSNSVNGNTYSREDTPVYMSENNSYVVQRFLASMTDESLREESTSSLEPVPRRETSQSLTTGSSFSWDTLGNIPFKPSVHSTFIEADTSKRLDTSRRPIAANRNDGPAKQTTDTNDKYQFVPLIPDATSTSSSPVSKSSQTSNEIAFPFLQTNSSNLVDEFLSKSSGSLEDILGSYKFQSNPHTAGLRQDFSERCQEVYSLKSDSEGTETAPSEASTPSSAGALSLGDLRTTPKSSQFRTPTKCKPASTQVQQAVHRTDNTESCMDDNQTVAEKKQNLGVASNAQTIDYEANVTLHHFQQLQHLKKQTEDFFEAQMNQMKAFMEEMNTQWTMATENYMDEIRFRQMQVQNQQRVFENMNNRPSDISGNSETKHLRDTDENKENRSHNKDQNSRYIRKEAQSSFNNAKKSRVQMPDIPIPQPLPSPLIKTNTEVDNLTSAIDNLLSDVPAHHYQGKFDSFCNPVYAQDVINYSQAQEKQYILHPAFLHNDSEVNPHMRAILIDWLTQVQSHLCLGQSTLHRAVRMIDVFLARQKVALPKFQLVGITCLLIAAKFEERTAPSIQKLILLTDNTYSLSEVLHMEVLVLKVLRFQVNLPLPTDYLPAFLRLCPNTDVITSNKQRVEHLSAYLLDLTLHDIHMVQWPASMVAAACLMLTLNIVSQHCSHQVVFEEDGDEELWGPLLQHLSGYSVASLMPCVQRCSKLLARADQSKYQGARDNYKNNKHGNISLWDGLMTPIVMELANMHLL